MKKLQIAIVGAGPAGLAAALYLKRSNNHVTLFERFESASPVGSGLILQPTGLTVLDDLGLFQAIQSLGRRIDRLYGTDALSGRTVLDVRYSALKGGRYGIAVHRAALFGVLNDAVLSEGIDIQTNVDVVSLEVGAGSAWLVTEAGRRVGAFDLVVDASGSRSKIKKFAHKSSEPKPLTYGAYWASLKWHSNGFDERSLQQRYRKAGIMIGVLPIGKASVAGVNSAAFFWSTKPDEEAELRNAGIAQWKDNVLSLWPECSVYLDQIGGFDDMTLALYGHHTLPFPIGRHLAVIGDAAHSTSPQRGAGGKYGFAGCQSSRSCIAHFIRYCIGLVIICLISTWAYTCFPNAVPSISRHFINQIPKSCPLSVTALFQQFQAFHLRRNYWHPWSRAH